jgi:hypothetical protein
MTHHSSQVSADLIWEIVRTLPWKIALETLGRGRTRGEMEMGINQDGADQPQETRTPIS